MLDSSKDRMRANGKQGNTWVRYKTVTLNKGGSK